MGMNICMVSDFFYPDYGGVEIHIQNLASTLIEMGNQVIVLTRSKNNFHSLYELNKIKIYYLPLKHFLEGTSLPYLSTLHHYLKQIILNEKIHIIHIHQFTSILGIEACLLSLLLNIPFVVTEHSMYGQSSITLCFLNLLIGSYYTYLDGVIFVSKTCLNNFALRMDLNYNHLKSCCQFHIITNGINTNIFNPQIKSKDYKSDKINIVCNSRLVDIKGTSILLSVISRIVNTYEDVNFIIIGDGPNKVSFYGLINKLHNKKRVVLYHNLTQSNVSKIYKYCHIYLHTSLSEAFGISVIEAIACGLRIVSTKCGALPDIIPDNSVKFAEEFSTFSVYNVLCQAIYDHRKNIDYPLVDYNYNFIKKMYSWEIVALYTLNVYEKSLRNKKSTMEKIRENIKNDYKYFTIFLLVILFAHRFIEFLDTSIHVLIKVMLFLLRILNISRILKKKFR